MKKIILILAFVLLASPAFALTLPDSQAGVAFSLADNKLNHMETFEIVKWKGLALSGGYMGDAGATDHKFIASVNYDILSLTKYAEWPIFNYVTFKPGLYVGYGSINMKALGDSELDWGINLTMLSFRF